MVDDAKEIVGKLTALERKFLGRVCDNFPLGCADREEDRVRQKCRRLGLVHVVQNPRRWEALPLGLQVHALLHKEQCDG